MPFAGFIGGVEEQNRVALKQRFQVGTHDPQGQQIVFGRMPETQVFLQILADLRMDLGCSRRFCPAEKCLDAPTAPSGFEQPRAAAVSDNTRSELTIFRRVRTIPANQLPVAGNHRDLVVDGPAGADRHFDRYKGCISGEIKHRIDPEHVGGEGT